MLKLKLQIWLQELTHLKSPLCWERLNEGEEGDGRGWDGWMASLTQWTWVWVNSGSWWWTGRPGVLQSMGRKESGMTEWLNWTELDSSKIPCIHVQSCLSLCDPMGCSPPVYSVHGIFQAGILEWFAIPFSKGSSPPRDWTRVSCISCTASHILSHWTTWEANSSNITIIQINNSNFFCFSLKIIYTLYRSLWEYFLFHILSIHWYYQIWSQFYFCPFIGEVELYFHGFNAYFPKPLNYLFICLLIICISLFVKCCSVIFCIFSLGCLCFS